MKIIFLTISYSENNHISFYEELLQEFVINGHEVFVACASEKRKQRKTEISYERGIRVLRIKTGNITGNVNIIEKGISTILIDRQFQQAIEKYFLNEKFDLILYPTPPITLVGTVSYLKKKSNAVSYLLLKDIFPQNAVDLGLMKKHGVKSILYKYFRMKEKKLYKISDYIGCMSPANCEYVKKHNPELNFQKIEVNPNCIIPKKVDIDCDDRTMIRKKYGVPTDKKIFVYGGNLGKPQGIDFVVDCINECKNIEEAFFLIVGGGSETGKIKKYIDENNATNAMLIGTLPKLDYQLLANSCDVGLIFLDYRFTIPNFPSRLLSYLQASMPVLVATDTNTDIGDIVENNGFGWKCMSNDVIAFRKCIEKALVSNINQMGKYGWEYLNKNYTVNNGYNIINKHFC